MHHLRLLINQLSRFNIVSTHQAEKLFSEFPAVSKADWEKLIKNDLNGADYREKLMWDTMEGFSLPPFSTSDDFIKKESTASHIQTTAWLCCEFVTESTISKANEAIRKALEGGADACLIRSGITADPDQDNYKMTGVPIQSQADMEKLIEGIEQNAELIFDCGMASPAMIAMLSNCGGHSMRSSAVFDPLTEAAKSGTFPVQVADIKNMIQDLCEDAGPNILCADVAFYHNAGATIIQELGIALSLGSEYLAMSDEKLRPKTADNLFLKLGTGPLFFPEIAKYRAIRTLWPKMLHAYGINNPKALRIFAETGKTNKTISDPYNNLLRSVTEAMSALTGGADILMVYPFDSKAGETDHFSLRIARNIQHMLREEAHFNKTDDPSSGSYYIEMVTEKIASESWKYFQQIESQGGFLHVLENGFIQREISGSREKKENEYAAGRRVLIGTNKFPDPGQKLSTGSNNAPAVTLHIRPDFAQNEPPDGFNFQHYKKAFASGAMLGELAGELYKPGKEKFLAIEEFRAGTAFDEIKIQDSLNTKEAG